MNVYPVNIGNRLASMVLDHFLMTIVMVVVMLPFTMATVTTDINSTKPMSPDLLSGKMLYIALFGMSVYLCKDCIGGRSLAKRILKHQVVDSSTSAPATPLQCLLRNFSIVFWPIEVIMVIINPEKRIGDRIAGTKVVAFDGSQQTATTNFFQIGLCLLLGFAFLYLITLSLH